MPEIKTDSIASRLWTAMEAEKKTPTRTGREAGLQQGYIFKLMGVARGKPVTSPGPEVLRQLADYLRVNYEWLAIGRGPMRADGYSPTAFEEAANFARRHGISEAAILATIERVRTDASLSAADWVALFVVMSRGVAPAAKAATKTEAARPRRKGAA